MFSESHICNLVLILLWLFMMTSRNRKVTVVSALIVIFLVVPTVQAVKLGVVVPEDAARFVRQYKDSWANKAFTGPPKPRKTTTELLAMATTSVMAAFTTAVFYLLNENEAEEGMETMVTFPKEQWSATGRLDKFEEIVKDAVFEDMKMSDFMLALWTDIPNSLVGFLAYHGTMTEKRYWIRLSAKIPIAIRNTSVAASNALSPFVATSSNTAVVMHHIFISMPSLTVEGHHNDLVMFFKDSISATLKDLRSSKVIDFVMRKNKNWKIIPELMFMKALHVTGNQINKSKETRNNWKKDMEEILRCMMNNEKDEGKLAEPKFFK